MATTVSGLTKASLTIPLTGGIDRKTDALQLSAGQMYTCDNVQYIVEKQLSKRFGYQVLQPPGSLQGAPFAAVGVRDGVEPIILGTGALNRFNPATGLSTYITANTQGHVSSTPITSSSGAGTTPSPPIDASIATDGQKYLLITWQEANGSTYAANGYANVYYGIQDIVSGAWVISPTSLQVNPSPNGMSLVNTTAPKALYYNGTFIIVLGEITTASSKYNYVVESYTLPLINLQQGFSFANYLATIASGTSIAQTKSLFSGWDAQISGTNLVLVTQGATGGGSGIIYVYNLNGVFTSTQGTFSLPNGVTGNAWRLSLAVGGPSATPYAVASPTGLCLINANLTSQGAQSFTSPTTQPINPVVCYWYGSTAYAFAEVSTSVGYSVGYVTSLGTFGYVNSPCTSQQCGIASRVWTYNSKMYFWQFVAGYAGSGTFRAYVLTEYTPATKVTTFVARTSYQDAWIANFGTMQSPCDVVRIPGANRWITMLPQTTDAYGGIPASGSSNPTYTSTYYGNLARAEFDFTPSSRTQMYNMPTGGLFIAGAFPLQYDGQSLSEAGFSVSPEFITSPGAFLSSPQFSSSGGSILAGAYYYYACYVRRDAYGNVIRSSPSIPYAITTTGSTGKVTFPAITYYGAANVYIEYYRTTLTTPSEPYYVGKAAAGQAFVDTFADSTIVTNFNLYTYGGEYPNDPPPAVHSVAFGETRAYIIPADARNSIWCSKKYSPGRSVEWTSNLILSEGGTHSGNYTAVAVLDTNVIVFKSDQIIYFNGDGPDNAGATGSFSSFQRLSSDVGCIDPGSLAIIPAGLLFRSKRGIELLTRGLQVSYVGFPIEPIVQPLASIASAVVMPQYQQVRFVSNTAGDPVLVYDYLHNRWSTYSGMAALSAANINGIYWWISSDGSTCNIETPGQFLDNGNSITMTIETPEIPLAGIQGWGRAYRMGIVGRYASPCCLTVSLAYDHDLNYIDQVLYNAYRDADVSNLITPLYADENLTRLIDEITSTGSIQFRLSRMPRQVMQTLRIKLQDSGLLGYYPSDGSAIPFTVPQGESCGISSIQIEYGQKAQLAKLSPARTV